MFPVSTCLAFCLSSLLFSTFSMVNSEFVSQGSTTDFFCEQKEGDSTPILRRNDDHHQDEAAILFFGSEKRPLIDDDWTANKTFNATSKVTKYHYHIKNVDFEDAGFYMCDLGQLYNKRNLSVIGHKIDCGSGGIEVKQGEPIERTCELPVDGPDPVSLGWFMNGHVVESKMKAVLPEDRSVSVTTDLTALPEHNDQTLECRFSVKSKEKFDCEVKLRVTFPVQLRGNEKSVVHGKYVETEIHVIGNPWVGKSALSVASDHIDESKTEMDELDSGYGAEVTVFIPVTAFNDNPKVNVLVKSKGSPLGSVDIELPSNKAAMTYIIVIVVLALAAILLVVLLAVFLKKRNSRQEEISSEGKKDVPMAEQPA